MTAVRYRNTRLVGMPLHRGSCSQLAFAERLERIRIADLDVNMVVGSSYKGLYTMCMHFDETPDFEQPFRYTRSLGSGLAGRPCLFSLPLSRCGLRNLSVVCTFVIGVFILVSSVPK